MKSFGIYQNIGCLETIQFAIHGTGSADAFYNILSPLLAAFFGSFITYRLGIRKENNAETQRKILSGSKCLIILISQYNYILNIYSQSLELNKNHPARSHIIHPMIHGNHQDFHVEISELVFLLNTRFKNIVGEIVVNDRVYFTILNLLQERSALHLEYQKKLELNELQSDISLTIDDIKKAVGDRIYFTLESMTDDLYDMIDSYIAETPKLVDKLAHILEDIFPKQKFFTVSKPATGE